MTKLKISQDTQKGNRVWAEKTITLCSLYIYGSNSLSICLLSFIVSSVQRVDQIWSSMLKKQSIKNTIVNWPLLRTVLVLKKSSVQ